MIIKDDPTENENIITLHSTLLTYIYDMWVLPSLVRTFVKYSNFRLKLFILLNSIVKIWNFTSITLSLEISEAYLFSWFLFEFFKTKQNEMLKECTILRSALYGSCSIMQLVVFSFKFYPKVIIFNDHRRVILNLNV